MSDGLALLIGLGAVALIAARQRLKAAARADKPAPSASQLGGAIREVETRAADWGIMVDLDGLIYDRTGVRVA